jgi:hypothetical protein
VPISQQSSHEFTITLTYRTGQDLDHQRFEVRAFSLSPGSPQYSLGSSILVTLIPRCGTYTLSCHARPCLHQILISSTKYRQIRIPSHTRLAKPSLAHQSAPWTSVSELLVIELVIFSCFENYHLTADGIGVTQLGDPRSHHASLINRGRDECMHTN